MALNARLSFFEFNILLMSEFVFDPANYTTIILLQLISLLIVVLLELILIRCVILYILLLVKLFVLDLLFQISGYLFS